MPKLANPIARKEERRKAGPFFALFIGERGLLQVCARQKKGAVSVS